MNAPLPKGDTRVSDVPISREVVSGLTSLAPSGAPSSWVWRLFQVASEAPHELGVRATALHMFLALSEILPELGLGLVATPPEQAPVVLRFPPGEPQGALLFPEMSWERTEPIPVPWPAELHIASCGEPLLEDGAELALLRSLVLALALSLRLAVASAQAQECAATKRQLAQADKLAAVGKLAASTLHELNNPLTTILAYADFLRRKVERAPLEAEDVERLRRISEAAERVQRLTRNLVDYARPSGETPTSLQLRDVLEQALSFCEHALDEVGALVERDYCDDDAFLGVHGELAQVFVNLIINACHAMPRGNGHLLLRSEIAGEQLVVRIRDNGHGVAPEHAPHIFEPFYTTKALGSGTGLGLSIVRAILERYQGTIAFRTPRDAGTEFIVRLPRRPL